MPLRINNDCIGCTFCKNECPVMAIYYDGDKYAIDPELCTGCGTCSEVCVMDAIEDDDKPAPAVIKHEPVHKKCDFVVVGGGAAGLIAAARHAELTGSKVIVLEKNKKPGGGGYFAVGLSPCNTKWEKDAGAPDCIDDKVRSAMKQTRWSLDKELVTNLYTSLGEVFDWLCTWAPVEKCFELAKNPFTGHPSVTTKDQAYGSGKFITTHILPYLEKLGVEVLTETAATELIMRDGRVSAVRAKDSGGEIIIDCKACLLCTGSLINSERIKEKIPQLKGAQVKRYAHDMPGLTGDGVDIAERAGVALNDGSFVLAFVGCMPVAFDEGLFKQGERSDAIRVNLDGKRWCDETGDNKTIAERLLYQPKCVSYTVMDSSILESAQPKAASPVGAGGPGGGPGGGLGGGQDASGPSAGIAMEFPYPGGVPDFAVTRTEPIPANREAFIGLAQSLGGKTVLCADTLGELAERMGAPADEFIKTVEQYNNYCEEGRDADFLKPMTHLRPLTEAPYFAIVNYLYLDGIFGGLDVDANMRVMSGGEPVEGLYAAGDITGGRYTNDLLHKTEIINDYSWAIAGGFMAAKHAAGQ